MSDSVERANSTFMARALHMILINGISKPLCINFVVSLVFT
jgi:hypothetical protein